MEVIGRDGLDGKPSIIQGFHNLVSCGTELTRVELRRVQTHAGGPSQDPKGSENNQSVRIITRDRVQPYPLSVVDTRCSNDYCIASFTR